MYKTKTKDLLQGTEFEYLIPKFEQSDFAETEKFKLLIFNGGLQNLLSAYVDDKIKIVQLYSLIRNNHFAKVRFYGIITVVLLVIIILFAIR